MKLIYLLICLFFAATTNQAQNTDEPTKAAPLDLEAARKALSTRVRNPVKSTSPIVKRTYSRNATKGVEVEIVERQDGTKEERPFVALPILFVRSKDELLDSQSAANATQMITVLKEVLTADPKATFTIQGHTSAEGEKAANQKLSDLRAAKINGMLSDPQSGIPATALSRVGFGPDFATAAANGPESERQKDRRVLLVRN